MTEALNTIIKWAFSDDGTKAIFAVTKKDNIPSQRVLLKVGMELYEEDEKFYKWIKKYI
jgi:RimJ/RimL family protein N-acetyltransferase